MIGEFALVAIFLVVCLVAFCDMRRRSRIAESKKTGKGENVRFFPTDY